ncbi:MAG: M23 family metallopeptidase [Nocardioides sp.]
MRPHPGPLLGTFLVALLLAGPAARADEPAPSGDAAWPLRPAPEVVAGFDAPSTRWGAGHRGVDLSGSLGQPVRAALPGTVSFAGRIAGRGVVVVDHGATRTTYEPVAATAALGQAVEAGERIGTLQLGGSHCFPAACLHWGLRAGDTYLDPLTLVGAGPVRLLPLGPSTSTAVTPSQDGVFPDWALPAREAIPPTGDGALFRGG